jgi:hypothetical protein
VGIPANEVVLSQSSFPVVLPAVLRATEIGDKRRRFLHLRTRVSVRRTCESNDRFAFTLSVQKSQLGLARMKLE